MVHVSGNTRKEETTTSRLGAEIRLNFCIKEKQELL